MRFLSLLVCFLLSVSFFISSCQKTADHTAEILEGINGIKFKNDSLLNVTIHLQKSLDSIKNQINQNTSILNSINTKITGLQVSIDTLISNIKVLNTKIDTANSNLNGLQVQMNNLSKQYLNLSSQISSVFATISVKIDSLNLQIGINNASINKLQTEYLVTQIKVDSILLAIQLNNQLLTNNNNNIAAIQAQLILLTNEYNTVITLLNQLISLINGQSTLATSINTGLIAWYPFSGNAIDSSGNGNNGTINGAVLTTDRFNVNNAAYNFDGVSNTIVISNFNQNPTLFTISLWFNPSANGHFGTRELLHRCDPTNVQNYCWNMSWGFANVNQGNYLVTGIYTNTTNWNNDGNNLQLNQWYNAVMTYDAINKNVYLNGSLISSTPISGQISYQNKTGLFIGYDSYWDFYQGKIDDIRIYNRALTTQEVNYLYTH